MQNFGRMNRKTWLATFIVMLPCLLLGREKPRVAVADFSVKAPRASYKLGTAMSDILIHALVQSGRYRVLERSVLDKVRQEQNLTLSGEVDAATGAKFGKLAGAEFLIVGTVSRFEEKTKGGGIGGVLSRKVAGGAALYESEVAVIVRVINSTSGEILLSEEISKKGRAVGVGAYTSVLGAPIAGGLFKSASMQKAIESAIDDAVKKIGERIPSEGGGSSDLSEITLSVAGINFGTLRKMTDMLTGLDGVEDVQKSLSDGVASITVQYKGTAEELADALYAKKSGDMDFEITGLSDSKIDMKMK